MLNLSFWDWVTAVPHTLLVLAIHKLKGLAILHSLCVSKWLVSEKSDTKALTLKTSSQAKDEFHSCQWFQEMVNKLSGILSRVCIFLFLRNLSRLPWSHHWSSPDHRKVIRDNTVLPHLTSLQACRRHTFQRLQFKKHNKWRQVLGYVLISNFLVSPRIKVTLLCFLYKFVLTNVLIITANDFSSLFFLVGSGIKDGVQKFLYSNDLTCVCVRVWRSRRQPEALSFAFFLVWDRVSGPLLPVPRELVS